MKPHQFQSITEQQWKSGLSRHKCARCSYDYSDPVHCVSNWPLVVVLEDCYVPEFASIVLEAAQEYTNETCGLGWALAGMKARGEIQVN